MERDWIHIHKKEPQIRISGGVVSVTDIRDYIHKSRHHANERFFGKKYLLKDLSGVWFGTQPLFPFKRFSHNFFIFEFGKEFLVVSVEARRKVGQRNPVLWGMLPLFRVLYTCTTEKDQFYLRSQIYAKDVFLYKLKLSSAESKKLLVEVAKRIDEVNSEKPKFNSIWRNCTTEILGCLDRAVPGRFGSKWRRYYNAKIDLYFYTRGLIDTKVSLEELRPRHNASRLVHSYKKGNFSAWIRQDLPMGEKSFRKVKE